MTPSSNAWLLVAGLAFIGGVVVGTHLVAGAPTSGSPVSGATNAPAIPAPSATPITPAAAPVALVPSPARNPFDDHALGELLAKREPWVWANPQTGVGVTIPALIQSTGPTQHVEQSSQWLFINLATDGWVLLKDNPVNGAMDDPKKAVTKYFNVLSEGGVKYPERGRWRAVDVADQSIQVFAAQGGRLNEEPLGFDTYFWRSPAGVYWVLTVRDPLTTAYASMTDGLLGQFVASTIILDPRLARETDTIRPEPSMDATPPPTTRTTDVEGTAATETKR